MPTTRRPQAARDTEAGPEHIGYLQRILVADTDEKAREIGKGYLVGNVGIGRIPLPPDYMAPIGYNSRDPKFRAMKERVRKDPFQLSPTGGAGGSIDTATWDEILNRRRIIVGSPETVIRQIRKRWKACGQEYWECGPTTAP